MTRLSTDCPHCHKPLQFNSFLAAAEDYAEIIRRGLKQSCREKSADHEETPVHLVALAVHLAAHRRPEEAVAFQHEHNEIADRVEGKKIRDET